jgi:adenylate kinase
MRKLIKFDWSRVSAATEEFARSLYWKVRKPTIVILMGPPGSGKGTTALRLAPLLKTSPLSTGDLFRKEIADRTPLGLRLESYINSGKLVPDALVIAVIRENLLRRKYWNGVVLDGFPRTLLQAKLLDKLLQNLGLSVDRVVLLAPAEDVIISRLSARLTCSNTTCGRTYHLQSKPPQVADICDACKSPLMRRKDDVPAVIADRLSTYRRESDPICEHYASKLRVIKPTEVETEEEVFAKVKAAL